MKKVVLVTLLALFVMTFLAGCGGRVYAPREGSAIWYYHPELPEAAKAVEDAEKAGKPPHSRSKCNKSRSDLERCFVGQAFPGPVVNQ